MASFLTGVVFARYILSGCWKNLIDTLSTPLTGRMAGSSRGLAFILGAEGVKEQTQRERDTICLSLDGLRKAAALSCALGNITFHSFQPFHLSSVEDGTLMEILCLLGLDFLSLRCGSQLCLSTCPDGSSIMCSGGERGEGTGGDWRCHCSRYLHTFHIIIV